MDNNINRKTLGGLNALIKQLGASPRCLIAFKHLKVLRLIHYVDGGKAPSCRGITKSISLPNA